MNSKLYEIWAANGFPEDRHGVAIIHIDPKKQAATKDIRTLNSHPKLAALLLKRGKKC